MKKIRQLAMLAFVLAFAHTLWGQAGTTGTILGTVTDTTGAVIAGAPVDVTNTSTGVTTRITSTGSGDYTAADLAPGPYKVSVQMSGFSKAVVSGIVLVVAQDARVNVQLKPGATSETVEVSASGVALDTDSSSVSQIVSEQQMSDLPLDGRNFTDLLFVGAGAVQTVGEQGQMRQSEGDAISINGSRPESNNYTLDGLTNTDTALSTPAVILSQDAMAALKADVARAAAVGQKLFPPSEAALITDLIRRDLPYYDAALSPAFIAGMTQFARRQGILDGEAPYARVVATQFAALWNG